MVWRNNLSLAVEIPVNLPYPRQEGEWAGGWALPQEGKQITGMVCSAQMQHHLLPTGTHVLCTHKFICTCISLACEFACTHIIIMPCI